MVTDRFGLLGSRASSQSMSDPCKSVRRSSRGPARSVGSSGGDPQIRNAFKRTNQRARAKAGVAAAVGAVAATCALFARSASVNGEKALCAAPMASGVERAIASNDVVGSAETSAGSRATRIWSNTSLVMSASVRLSEICTRFPRRMMARTSSWVRCVERLVS